MDLKPRALPEISLRSGLLHIVFVIALFAISGCTVDGSAALSKGDYVTAVRLWRTAAERGDPSAQYALGVMYDKGQGVPQDRNEALIWYRKSAAQGHVFPVSDHETDLIFL